MPRYIHLAAHLSPDEVEQRYRKAADPVEWSHFQMLWLLACGKRIKEVAEVMGDSCELDQDSCSALQLEWSTGSC